MNLNLNKGDKLKLQELFLTKARNIATSEIALELVDEFTNGDLTRDFFHVQTSLQYRRKIKSLYNFDQDNNEDKIIFDVHLLPSINEVDLSEFYIDPYYQTIKGLNINEKNLSLTMLSYQKNQLFIFDDVVNKGDYFKEHLSLAYSKENYPYLALVENNQIWMAIIPHEIKTMQASVKQAKGKVLILGLGIGYYPFMISQKIDVSEITIVENNQAIIDIFTKYLLPHFPSSTKIEVIKDDAFKYLRTNHQNFTYAFFDIYRSSDDGLPLYIKALRQEHLYPNLHVDYWLEGSLIALLRRIVITIIEENYYDYKLEEEGPLDELFTYINMKIKDYTFNNYDDIKNLLTKDSLVKLVK